MSSGVHEENPASLGFADLSSRDRFDPRRHICREAGLDIARSPRIGILSSRLLQPKCDNDDRSSQPRTSGTVPPIDHGGPSCRNHSAIRDFYDWTRYRYPVWPKGLSVASILRVSRAATLVFRESSAFRVLVVHCISDRPHCGVFSRFLEFLEGRSSGAGDVLASRYDLHDRANTLVARKAS